MSITIGVLDSVKQMTCGTVLLFMFSILTDSYIYLKNYLGMY